MARSVGKYEEIEFAAMEAGDWLGGRGILDHIVLWEKSAEDRKADRIFTERMRWLLKIALSIANKSGNAHDKAEILGIYAHSLYFHNPRDSEQYAKEALQSGETWGNAQAVLDAVRQANETAERQRKEYEARQKAEQKERERQKMETMMYYLRWRQGQS